MNRYKYDTTEIDCYFCGKKIGYVGLSMTFYNRYKFFCSIECKKEGNHGLKIKENRGNSNLVDTSTYALKKLLNLPPHKIPASIRIAMFQLFKTRKEIQCLQR